VSKSIPVRKQVFLEHASGGTVGKALNPALPPAGGETRTVTVSTLADVGSGGKGGAWQSGSFQNRGDARHMIGGLDRGSAVSGPPTARWFVGGREWLWSSVAGTILTPAGAGEDIPLAAERREAFPPGVGAGFLVVGEDVDAGGTW